MGDPEMEEDALREMVNAPGGPGGESFVSFFPATGLTVSGTQKLDKRAVSSISGSPEGMGSCGQASLDSHSPSSLASEQLWAVRECDQSYYSRTLCQDVGRCCAHSDPASDRHRDARTGSLRSPSLPHRGYVGGSIGATCTVSGSLVSASQSVSLAPSDHQTRLCDSVRPASSQVQGHPLHFSEGGRCSCLARRDRSPSGEGCDRAGTSSRYEDGVAPTSLYPRKAVGPEPGPSQASVQDAHAETYLRMHPSLRLVCSDRPEGRVLPCVDPSAPQAIPAVCVRRTGISVQSPALRTAPLGGSWPRGLRKYAFPPVSLLAQTLCKIRKDEEQVLLVAPYWPTRTWFPELMLLVTAPPWQIPLRKDLLTQRRGTLLHPRPDLWKLHVWSLDGTRRF